MFFNYLKTSIRNLLRGKVYSVINLLGLTIGTSTVILLALYVHDEWTFDKFHTHHDRIYRAWVKEHLENDVFFNTVTPYILGEELRSNFPEIETVARYNNLRTQVRKESTIELESVHVVEPEFFQIFDFDLLLGTAPGVFANLHSAVITEEMSRKYFGDPRATGQTLTMQMGGQWTDFVVTGIIENAPGNSSLQYDILIPFENTKSFMSEGGRTSWTNVNVETYVLLNTRNEISELEAKVAPFMDSKVAEMYAPGEYLIGFQPLTDMHLNTDFPEGFVRVSDRRYPYILSGVALLILLLACINFTALAVGRSISRAKEVGVRKSSGASRMQIMLQFWSEAILTSCVGVVLAIGLAKVMLHPFNTIADKQLTLDLNALTIGSVLSLALVTGLISGAYPALVLSGFSPARTLRGAITKLGSDKHLLLRSLVGFQFLLSILLIICAIVMTRQLQYIQEKNLGFAKDQMLVLPYARSGASFTEVQEEGKTVLERLRQTVGGRPGFGEIASATHAIGTPGWVLLGYMDAATQKVNRFYLCGADHHLIPVLQLQMQEGRNFSPDASADKHGVVVNETFARMFGTAVGDALPEPFEASSVIGIVKDFNFESLHNTVEPLVLATSLVDLFRAAPDMVYTDYPNPKFLIRLDGDHIPATISTLRQVWREIAPEQPFVYTFMDENIDRLYRAEARLSQVMAIATFLAIFIACLGLFGIVTLTVAQRTKEIGIRKVLGASTLRITRMLTQDFVKLIVLAAIPASLVAWYLMSSWLDDFAYRIHVGWWIFALAAGVAIAVACITAGLQSVRAALGNPVTALRSE